MTLSELNKVNARIDKLQDQLAKLYARRAGVSVVGDWKYCPCGQHYADGACSAYTCVDRLRQQFIVVYTAIRPDGERVTMGGLARKGTETKDIERVLECAISMDHMTEPTFVRLEPHDT